MSLPQLSVGSAHAHKAVNAVQLTSTNSLSFSDLVLYVRLAIRETTQKQKEQPALSVALVSRVEERGGR